MSHHRLKRAARIRATTRRGVRDENAKVDAMGDEEYAAYMIDLFESTAPSSAEPTATPTTPAGSPLG